MVPVFLRIVEVELKTRNPIRSYRLVGLSDHYMLYVRYNDDIVKLSKRLTVNDTAFERRSHVSCRMMNIYPKIPLDKQGIYTITQKNAAKNDQKAIAELNKELHTLEHICNMLFGTRDH